MHEYIYSAALLINPPFASIFDLFHSPFAWIDCPFYLLGDPFSCDCGANIHPLSSLVSNQLFTPCCLTHPEDTHGSSYMFTLMTSQHQLLCLIQIAYEYTDVIVPKTLQCIGRLCKHISQYPVMIFFSSLEALWTRVSRAYTGPSLSPNHPTLGCYWRLQWSNQFPFISFVLCGPWESIVLFKCRHRHSLAQVSYTRNDFELTTLAMEQRWWGGESI